MRRGECGGRVCLGGQLQAEQWLSLVNNYWQEHFQLLEELRGPDFEYTRNTRGRLEALIRVSERRLAVIERLRARSEISTVVQAVEGELAREGEDSDMSEATAERHRAMLERLRSS